MPVNRTTQAKWSKNPYLDYFATDYSPTLARNHREHKNAPLQISKWPWSARSLVMLCQSLDFHVAVAFFQLCEMASSAEISIAQHNVSRQTGAPNKTPTTRSWTKQSKECTLLTNFNDATEDENGITTTLLLLKKICHPNAENTISTTSNLKKSCYYGVTIEMSQAQCSKWNRRTYTIERPMGTSQAIRMSERRAAKWKESSINGWDACI